MVDHNLTPPRSLPGRVILNVSFPRVHWSTKGTHLGESSLFSCLGSTRTVMRGVSLVSSVSGDGSVPCQSMWVTQDQCPSFVVLYLRSTTVSIRLYQVSYKRICRLQVGQ